MNPERLLNLGLNKKLLALEATILLVVGGAASSAIASSKDNNPPCIEPAPNAILIPLARPEDDNITLIPLGPVDDGRIEAAPAGKPKLEPIPLAPNVPVCPLVQAA